MCSSISRVLTNRRTSSSSVGAGRSSSPTDISAECIRGNREPLDWFREPADISPWQIQDHGLRCAVDAASWILTVLRTLLMPVIHVAQIGNPFLREHAHAVDERMLCGDALHRLLANLVDTMRAYRAV